MGATGTITDTNLLRISEAAAGLVEGASGSAVADDGTVTLHLIRPCVGKGRGRHVYEAAMLKRHAESGHFNDWKMYIDHESPAARRAAGGLPRKVTDLGGRILETWWDDSVPAGGRFGRGAVAAKVLPVPYVQELIRHDAKLIEASINTHATGVRPTSAGGRPAYTVEGFDQDGSVDWVTRAGAGGKVVSLMEAAMEAENDGDQIKNLLEGWSDDQIAAYLRDERPHLAENLHTDAGNGEEDDVKPEELAEAISTHLASDAGKQQLSEAFSEAAEPVVKAALENVLPVAIGRAAEVIEANATNAADRAVRIGALRASAATAVAEAKRASDDAELPEKFQAKILEAINALDLEDKVEGEGAEERVTETIETQFAAALRTQITEAWELVDSIAPASAAPRRRRRTAVTENGGGTDPKRGAERVREAASDETDVRPYRIMLREADVDLEAAYGIKPKAKPEKPEKDDDKATA